MHFKRINMIENATDRGKLRAALCIILLLIYSIFWCLGHCSLHEVYFQMACGMTYFGSSWVFYFLCDLRFIIV